MSKSSYDVIVLGGGPGGYTAAIRAAQLGKRTAIIERERLGGICLNWGCVPTKALLRNAEIFRLFQASEQWGISADNLRFDFPKIIKRSRGIADRISKGVEYLMKKNGIEVFAGAGRLLSRRGRGGPGRRQTHADPQGGARDCGHRRAALVRCPA